MLVTYTNHYTEDNFINFTIATIVHNKKDYASKGSVRCQCEMYNLEFQRASLC